MSVIAFPRRVERRPIALGQPSRQVGAHQRTRRSAAVRTKWRGASPARRSAILIGSALAVSLAGSMLAANRQIELHRLQSNLLQAQSNYAVQVGSLTNVSAPSEIASRAGALHLVDPTTVTQVPAVSLDRPLPLPKFIGYAPVTSRTHR